MKQGRTLPDLSAELLRQAQAKRDFVAPARSILVRSNGHTDICLNEPYQMNEIAHGQLAEYTGVPKGFYDRLRGASEDLRIPVRREEDDSGDNTDLADTPLFDVTVNALLKSKGPDARLVRTLDGRARAFLSDSYNPDLDNYDVFRVAARVMEEQGLGPDNVVSAEVTERKLYLKVVSPKLEAVVNPDNIRDRHGYLKEPQVIQAGFIISNSETGLGSLSVQQTVMRLMCTNLWIKEEAYRQRHIGKVLESDNEGMVYRSDTRAADAHARLLKVRDHVADALNEQKFMSLVGKMQETTGIQLEGGVDKIVEVTARKFGLSPGEKEDVLRHLILGADLSLWGLTNAITSTAEHATSYDRATELEVIGGRFFSLPDSEIRELVTAT